MRTFTSPTQRIGKIGEDIVCEYLLRQGFTIKTRNYTKKWGELDIVCSKGEKTHFIEVKSVSCEIFDENSDNRYRPEDQMHSQKRKRLIRVIQIYMNEHVVGEWQFDVVCVFLNHSMRLARLKFLRDIIIS